MKEWHVRKWQDEPNIMGNMGKKSKINRRQTDRQMHKYTHTVESYHEKTVPYRVEKVIRHTDLKSRQIFDVRRVTRTPTKTISIQYYA